MCPNPPIALDPGSYAISTVVGDQTYYVGPSTTNSNALSLNLPASSLNTNPTFALGIVNGGNSITLNGKLVEYVADGSLTLGNDNVNSVWNFVPLGNNTYRIKGGPSGQYGWAIPQAQLATPQSASIITVSCGGTPPNCITLALTLNPA